MILPLNGFRSAHKLPPTAGAHSSVKVGYPKQMQDGGRHTLPSETLGLTTQRS